jgi:dGTPase
MPAADLTNLYDDSWWLERPYEEDPQASADVRMPLERDRDRIVHSRALRRLGGKTQVIGSPWAYDFRNRLTHTVEVGQVGRSLARKHQVDEALIEAACMAHDIGHPPFGHAGERALNRLMREHGGFDANAQTLRTLCALEIKGVGTAGLNLTRATYWSILKYPYRRTGPRPEGEVDLTLHGLRPGAAAGEVVAESRFLYDVDLDKLVADGRAFGEWLGDGRMTAALPSAARIEGPPPRVLACRLMDWADDLAYAIHDFEDAVLANFITRGAIKRVRDPLLAAVQHELEPFYDGNANALEDAFGGWEREIDSLLDEVQKAVDPEAVLRPKTRDWFGTLVDAVSIGEPTQDDATTLGFRVDVPRKSRVLVSVLARLGFELMIRDERIVRYLRKGTMMLERSFAELMADPKIVDERVGQLMPRHVAAQMTEADGPGRARVVCDFLASMSEPGLAHFYATVFEANAGSPLR